MTYSGTQLLRNLITMQTDNPQIGVIGLGLLGHALAERLLSAGFQVAVYNRTKEKAHDLLARGATWSDNPLAECPRLVLCLYTTETVSAVLRQMRHTDFPGRTLIDTTTGNPQQTAALGNELAEAGIDYLESPIAASSQQTREGKAVAFVAGRESVYQSCQDIYSAIAPKSFFVGTWGDAAMTKLVNNQVLGLTRAALAEGIVLARNAGLDPERTLEVLKQGNAYSVVMDVKGQKMIQQDYSVQGKLSQHLKDVRLIKDVGARHGLELPLTLLHEQLLSEAESAGLGEQDNSAIVETIASRKSPQ